MTLFREAAAAAAERGAGARGGRAAICLRPPGRRLPGTARPPRRSHLPARPARPPSMRGLWSRGVQRSGCSGPARAGRELTGEGLPLCGRPCPGRPGRALLARVRAAVPGRPGLGGGPRAQHLEGRGACAGRGLAHGPLPPLPGARPADPAVHPTLTASWGPPLHAPRTPTVSPPGARPGVGRAPCGGHTPSRTGPGRAATGPRRVLTQAPGGQRPRGRPRHSHALPPKCGLSLPGRSRQLGRRRVGAAPPTIGTFRR